MALEDPPRLRWPARTQRKACDVEHQGYTDDRPTYVYDEYEAAGERAENHAQTDHFASHTQEAYEAEYYAQARSPDTSLVISG